MAMDIFEGADPAEYVPNPAEEAYQRCKTPGRT
jgi:hypothetical protein